MQQWWFDDILGLKSVFMVFFFMIFPNLFKVFINIHEYANYLEYANKIISNLHIRPWGQRPVYGLEFGTNFSSLGYTASEIK